MTLGGRLSLLLFLGIWTAGTLALDVHFGSAAVRQVRALSFPTVTGRIIESRVATQSDGDGSSHRAVVRFCYEVGGRRYESDQWRYQNVPTNFRRDAQRTVGRFRAGRPATVWYNPADPQDAVLAPGIRGLDAFALLFLTPFNAVMLAGLYAAVATALGRGAFARHPHGNVRIEEAGGVTRACLASAVCALVGSMAAIFVLSIPAMLVVVFCSGFDGSPAAPLSALALVLALTLVGCVRHRRAVAAGEHDLVLDSVRRVVVLPRAVVKGKPVEVAFAKIDRIGVDMTRSRAADDEPNWDVTLAAAGGRWTILTRSDRAESEAFAAWLTGRIVASGNAAALRG